MAQTQKRKAKTSKMPASICWFEVPADDLGRAKKFYGSLFGWKFAKLPAAIADYWHIDTAGKDASPDGGLMPRLHPEQSITVYVSVPSVDTAVTKVEKLGETVCKPKTAVPHMGYFAVCKDTEHNTFALWEMNEQAA
jgi:predicted enzyme related to lactoylglutathione lyase